MDKRLQALSKYTSRPGVHPLTAGQVLQLKPKHSSVCSCKDSGRTCKQNAPSCMHCVCCSWVSQTHCSTWHLNTPVSSRWDNSINTASTLQHAHQCGKQPCPSTSGAKVSSVLKSGDPGSFTTAACTGREPLKQVQGGCQKRSPHQATSSQVDVHADSTQHTTEQSLNSLIGSHALSRSPMC